MEFSEKDNTQRDVFMDLLLEWSFRMRPTLKGLRRAREREMAANIQECPTVTMTQSARKGSKRVLERILHFLAYHFILKRRTTRRVCVAGLQLTVGPTVFDPRFFLTSKFFAEFILSLDLSGKRVADVGTGSGILALAAAKAGAAEGLAIDINPYAVAATAENARANQVASRVTSLVGDLFSAIPLAPQFDVIITNPPFFEGQARDVADRAWCAGINFKDIATLFEQARERLLPGGRVYVVLSSNCNLSVFAELIERAGFQGKPVRERSYITEDIIIYQLHATENFPKAPLPVG